MGNKQPVDPIADLATCLHNATKEEEPALEKIFVKVFKYYNKSGTATLNKEEIKVLVTDLFQVAVIIILSLLLY
jgi:hypothetical protein